MIEYFLLIRRKERMETKVTTTPNISNLNFVYKELRDQSQRFEIEIKIEGRIYDLIQKFSLPDVIFKLDEPLN